MWCIVEVLLCLGHINVPVFGFPSPSESPGSIKAFVAGIATSAHLRLAQCKHFLNLAFAQMSQRHCCRKFCLFYKMQVDDFSLCKVMAKQQVVAMTTHPPIVQINDSTLGIIMGHAASSLLDRTDDLVTRRRSQSVGKAESGDEVKEFITFIFLVIER